MLINDKKFIVNKSPYNMANQVMLDSILTRFNSKYYDVKIVEKDTHYLIIAISKVDVC